LLRIPPERITQTVALLLTAWLLWLLFTAPGAQREPPPGDPGVQVSLLEVPPAPAPKPEPDKPKPRVVKVLRAAAPAAVPEPAPIVAPPADSPEEPVLAAAEPVEAPAPPTHASIEAAYAAALRQNIDARTTAPDTAQYRLLHPTGEVVVRFRLDRGGVLSEVALERTSGSHILDSQALAIVSSGRYPPFPEAAYPGEARHVFRVTIEFHA
jgi:periplasmic protein TonB